MCSVSTLHTPHRSTQPMSDPMQLHRFWLIFSWLPIFHLFLRRRCTSAEHANAISIYLFYQNSSNFLLSISLFGNRLKEIYYFCRLPRCRPHSMHSAQFFFFVGLHSSINIFVDRLIVGGDVSTKVKRLRPAIIGVGRC